MSIARVIEGHCIHTGEALFNIKYRDVERAVKLILEAQEKGKTVYLMGNGGSHSTASHMQNDLMKMCGIKAICVSDMPPTNYAYANDEGYGQAFVGPLRTLAQGGDVIFGISCSGNSENVVNAFIEMRKISAKIILMTGQYSGRAEQYADVTIHTGHHDIKMQENCHSVLCHAMIDAIQVQNERKETV